MPLSPTNTQIGFIGLGVMGAAMAGHLLSAGYKLHVYNRTKARAADLIEKGAIWHDSVAAVAQNSNVIITMIGYPKDVQEVYLGADGIIKSAKQGTYVIDMTTSKPSLAKLIYENAKQKVIRALDAPVTGGDVGAKEAKLSIMVGGDKSDFDQVLPILKLLGTNIVLQGGAGSGQHTKMCNQIAIAGTMLGLCECLAYAKKAGFDLDATLKSIEFNAAGSWALSNYAPRIIAGNYAPGFYVHHFIKDLDIALEEAKAMKLELPGLETAKRMYEKLSASGGAELGTQSLFKLYVGEMQT